MKKFIVFLLLLSLLTGCSPAATKEEAKSEKTLMAMDTIMELTAYGENAEDALRIAEARIKYLDLLLSTEGESSDTARVNREGMWTLSEDSAYLLRRSLEIYSMTDGLFDITVYPLMELWGFPSGEYRVPSEEEIQEILPFIGADQLTFDEETGKLTLQEGQKIDFGGIGKGYTSAKVIEVLKQAGVKSAIISLGGNIQCLGTKPDGSLWRVGIQDPKNEESGIAAVVTVADCAVITSGGYRRFFEDEATGHVYCHIVDPFTGYPAKSDLSSVTIICEDAVLADGLSTALYLMGKSDAITFWQHHSEEFEVVLIDAEGNIFASEGLKDNLTSDRKIQFFSISK